MAARPGAVDVLAPFVKYEDNNGFLDIFITGGSGTPAVRLQTRGGSKCWVDLTPAQAVDIAQALIKAASSIADTVVMFNTRDVAFKVLSNAQTSSPYTRPIEPQLPKPKRGRSPSRSRRIPRLDAAAADGVDDVPGRVDGHAQGSGGQA